MLAVLAEEPFSDPSWVFERKLDGERALTVFDGDRLRLVSRNGKDLEGSYPEIAEALLTAPTVATDGKPDFILDGEIVAFSGSVTSFSRLQERVRIHDPEEARRSSVAVYYYVFDLLHLDGHGLAALPLRTRKNLLERAFSFSDPIRLNAHRYTEGEAMHRDACSKGWEGIMAKRADSPYRHRRSSDWVKFKCVNRQELVIGGFTEPGGSRTGFGALLVGYYDGDELRYAGKVGTGFDDDTLERISRMLSSRECESPPFSPRGALPRQNVHWVCPDLVGRFGFTEWTDAGKLRHPRFLGLRRDKDPGDVTRERSEQDERPPRAAEPSLRSSP